jgi:hypothetical protein
LSSKIFGDYILDTGRGAPQNSEVFNSTISRENMKESYAWVFGVMDCCKTCHNLLIRIAIRFVFPLKEIQYFSLNKRRKNNAQIL